LNWERNLRRDPASLCSPCPTKTKARTMMWANRHGINICGMANIAARARIRSISITFHILELPISIDYLDRLTSISASTGTPAYLTSNWNEQQTCTILFCLRKSVTEERISEKKIHNLITQLAKVDGRHERLLLEWRQRKPVKVILLSISVIWKGTFEHNTYETHARYY